MKKKHIGDDPRRKIIADHIKELEKAVSTVPGSLVSRKNKGRTYYSIRTFSDGKRTEKNLSKTDGEQLRMLVQKKYNLALLASLKKELDALDKGLRYNQKDKYDIYNKLPDEYKKLAVPTYKTSEYISKHWGYRPYKKKVDKYSDELIYQTLKGEKVRSKNELIVANKLFEAGIPYHYEESLILPNGEIVSPDFTIMHPITNQIYYLEIFGLMDRPEYVKKSMYKIHWYSMRPDYDRFIFVFDYVDTPFGPEVIDNIIQNVFLKDPREGSFAYS